jgi:small subunit ribosomal protein S6
MALYESTFISRQDVSAQEVEKITESFVKIINDGNGKVVKIEQWGLRDLAYPIKKCKKGYYTHMGIEVDYPTLKELDRKFKLNENVIRHIFFVTEKIDEQLSPILMQDAGGDEIVIGGKEEVKDEIENAK